MEDEDFATGWAGKDIVPALTRRVAYLEGRLATTQADLDAARRRIAAYAEADRTLNAARADAYRTADEIGRRAKAEGDEILERAVDERKILTNEIRRLDAEREILQGGDPQLRPAFDLATAVMEEMRALLLEIMNEFRARPVALTAPVEHREELVATPSGGPIEDAYVEGLRA